MNHSAHHNILNRLYHIKYDIHMATIDKTI